MKKELNFMDHILTNQDIPGEKTLSFVITGCRRDCAYCKFPAQRTGAGQKLNEHLTDLLEEYEDFVSCVCLIGGDDPETMEDLQKCLTIAREFGLKTAVFSSYAKPKSELLPFVDYIKINRCDVSNGAITSNTTNQRLYQVNNDLELKDITSKFWKKGH